jgi:hypothetical protein
MSSLYSSDSEDYLCHRYKIYRKTSKGIRAYTGPTGPTGSAGPIYNTGTTGVKFIDTRPINSIYYLGSNQILVGGYFDIAYTSTTIAQRNTHNIAIMNIGGNWTNTPSPIPALNGPVNSIVQMPTGIIYVGGQFTNLSAGNQTLNYLTYWDTTNKLWMSVVSGSFGLYNIGVNNIVYALEAGGFPNIYVGGQFTTGGITTLNGIGVLNTSFYTWSQMIDALSTDIGVNNIVRNIHYSGSTAYICGDFTATGSNTSPLYRDAKINASNQIQQIKNNSGSHIGMNNTVYSNLYISPNIYFGGIFTNASPTADLSMSNLSYFTTTTTVTPLTINTSTSGFLDTEDGNTYSQIVIPTQYKNVNLIYNSTLNKWLETYRSTGVTH